MDDPSLSEHEQRILQEIERQLAAEDPDFVRQVQSGGPSKNTVRIARLSVLAMVLGFGLLLGYAFHVAFGIVGFLVMLVGAVGIGTSVRQLSAGGRGPSGSVLDVLKRAEGRMRPRRPPDQG